eukprot:g162.t1
MEQHIRNRWFMLRDIEELHVGMIHPSFKAKEVNGSHGFTIVASGKEPFNLVASNEEVRDIYFLGLHWLLNQAGIKFKVLPSTVQGGDPNRQSPGFGEVGRRIDWRDSSYFPHMGQMPGVIEDSKQPLTQPRPSVMPRVSGLMRDSALGTIDSSPNNKPRVKLPLGVKQDRDGNVHLVLKLKCRRIPKIKFTAKCDPLCTVHLHDGARWRLVGSTERLVSTNDPTFSSKVWVPWTPGKDQQVKVSLYDLPTKSKRLRERQRVGSAV